MSLPAKNNALNPGKDMSHRSDHVLVEVGALLSAHHRDGQVQFGAGIKAYPESFHSLQVVDLARDELTAVCAPAAFAKKPGHPAITCVKIPMALPG